MNIDNLLKYFNHNNYLKINNMPVFFLHHPWFMTKYDIDRFKEVLNHRCRQVGFSGVHFILNSMNEEYSDYINYYTNFNYKHSCHRYIDNNTQLNCLNYKAYFDNYNNNSTIQMLTFDFDNSARFFKPNKLELVTICKNNTELDKIMAINKIVEKYNKQNKSEVENILLINAWNEWGEKMHIEPSNERGYYYLNLLNDYMS